MNPLTIKKCPKCGSTDLVPILYDKTNTDEETERMPNNRESIPGGCRAAGAEPEYRCSGCGAAVGAPPVLMGENGPQDLRDMATSLHFYNGTFGVNKTQILTMKKKDGKTVIEEYSTGEPFFPPPNMFQPRPQVISEPIEYPADQWAFLLNRLFCDLCFHEWENSYHEEHVLDGSWWGMEIGLSNGQKLSIYGNVRFPPYWEELKQTINGVIFYADRAYLKKKEQSTAGKTLRIETNRLVICEFTPEMAQAVRLNSLDEDTRRFVPDEVFETAEDARDTVEYLISRYGGAEGPFVYPVLLKTGENVGYVQLVPCEEGWEIGYHIAKAFTGNGYATEAVRAFLPVMAKEHGITEIYGVCLAENAASVRVMEKCGFTPLFRGEGAYQGETREIVKTVWKTQEEETLFECSYTWDEKITEEVMRALVLRRPQSVLLFLLVGCMIPASVGAAVWIYRLSGKIDALSCIAVAVSCLLPAVFLWSLFRAGRSRGEGTKGDVEVTLTVTENGIACRDTSGDAPAVLSFCEISRIYDVKNALVLQMRDNATYAFVCEGFTKGTPEALKRFLREKRKKKAQKYG